MRHPTLTDSVAVIVPVHRGAAELALLGESIRRLDWPRELLQVIVAVDGPDDSTERVAHSFADDVVVLPENRGSYAARNAALRAVREEVTWVAFTDADCRVMPGWLRAHAHALQTAPLSGGAIDVTLRRRPSPAEVVDRMRHLKQEQYVTVDGFAATANLAVHRDVADALQFRADVRSGGDADFCLRAKDAGHQLVYTGDAAVEHPARQTTRDVLTKVHRICKGIESNPDRWADRAVPRPRARLYVARLGYQQGYSRSPIWMLRGVILDWWCERLVYRSAARTRTAARRG